jgi:ribosomal protein S6
MRKYDGLYIFAGAVKEDGLEKQVDRMRGEITRLSGVILNSEVLGKRTFARPMGKRESGVYVRIRFEIDPAAVKTLLERYRLIEELFRVQVLAVDERREEIIAEQIAVRKAREAEAQAAAAAAAAEAVEA